MKELFYDAIQRFTYSKKEEADCDKLISTITNALGVTGEISFYDLVQVLNDAANKVKTERVRRMREQLSSGREITVDEFGQSLENRAIIVVLSTIIAAFNVSALYNGKHAVLEKCEIVGDNAGYMCEQLKSDLEQKGWIFLPKDNVDLLVYMK